MNTAAKLGSYVLGLAVVFGGALGVGRAVGPVGQEPPKESHAAMAEGQEHGDGQDTPEQTSDKTGSTSTTSETSNTSEISDTPGGLQVSQNGYTLNPLTPIETGKTTDFRFTVTGPSGRPVTDYQVEHDKKLHFIVVSRDLTTFLHVHPEMTPDGIWSVGLTLPEAGAYRAFADFAPTGGEKLTLGADLQAAGDYRPKPLPEASRASKVGDYTVSLDGELVPGQASKLTLTVSKDGEPVTDLQPYLGAFGHLVALRAGDLAYLHVHPEQSDKAGPQITFYAEVPSVGDYRLFLDFKHGDEVRTADFTVRAAQGGATTAEPSAPHGH
ncbi:hypothetical protein DMB42_33545 [Nonomuraea sp. WAC 01424]|uniref:hypothetical protein n=1 Tax=Nonomuraea sp. WAC 01424 TaxID=2203200 RepID=UPI000F7A15D3|nr:hypothetical protein [Nonomuraea sp. WAC 01424]RSN03631.1 hypothetical protein DMB42_33545 [Nonomuraea sp. WAC 01424]